MKITWDGEAKAVYVYLVDEQKQSFKTVEVHGGDVYLDYDSGHELIGIEILNVDSQPVLVNIGRLTKK